MHYIPEGYKSKTKLRETEIAIKLIKDYFETNLAAKLNLTRVSAPLFVRPETGLNDNLNGVERPVSFSGIGTQSRICEIVQSLAKWKRMALKRYNFLVGEGLYTDMNAIRCDETLDNIHSIYVDQWDWEKVILEKDRTIETLKNTVNKIYEVFLETEKYVCSKFAAFEAKLPKEVTFITSQELMDLYPELSAKDREKAFVKEKEAIFIMQIGDKLSNGQRHDGRSPDYDDWNLNGDLILYHHLLDIAFEVSSMGIRVDAEAMNRQLTEADADNRRTLPYHQDILNNRLPFTIGGGIGQSRICMYFMDKVHIGEVQASVWEDDMLDYMAERDVEIL
ncbi:aspartate--ammonia ligase [Anaerocolumna cellulosilytica]|uniref:Aspartate--ammonia ligase n=1 Tax=Anaerocolumna cellulosilytica TaxID=433286 RepID=A0A6S6R1D4_9FIRM|nr:aspartate--ammonia ligase [Anaerocolumna cellulosilytica]MBB5195633.1 aspartate--ammonia ligase [Anaerocolumna cellulosilytica]BCJ93877.1 aspartate--ammonia ligase [Anaerocolumna cellulosilytica]